MRRRGLARAAWVATLTLVLLVGMLAALLGVWAAASATAELERIRLHQPPARGRRARPERDDQMDNQPSALPSYATSLLRSLLGFLGGFLVSNGLVTAEQVPELVGAGMVAASVAWGLIQKHNAHKALKAAIDAPAGQAR